MALNQTDVARPVREIDTYLLRMAAPPGVDAVRPRLIEVSAWSVRYWTCDEGDGKIGL